MALEFNFRRFGPWPITEEDVTWALNRSLLDGGDLVDALSSFLDDSPSLLRESLLALSVPRGRAERMSRLGREQRSYLAAVLRARRARDFPLPRDFFRTASYFTRRDFEVAKGVDRVTDGLVRVVLETTLDSQPPEIANALARVGVPDSAVAGLSVALPEDREEVIRQLYASLPSPETVGRKPREKPSFWQRFF